MKTAENKKNYDKLQELYRRLTSAIRKYFHSIPVFPKDPKDLYNALKRLQKQIKKLGFTKQQLDLLFPSSNETDSEKFDPSIFRKLIAHFGCVKHPKFWTSNELPPSSDTTAHANILRLFIERNKIMHLVGYISTADYNVHSKNITDALVSLGEDRATFYNLLPPKQYCLTNPVANFCGRNAELKQIHDIVESGKNSMLRIVVYGMSGLGKSEMIRKYCDKHGQTFDDNILWIDSTSKSTLESSFRDIAETLLKLEIKDQNGHYKGNHFIVDSVHQYFRSENILYIFDDVTNIKILKTFLPNHPDSCSIITSQLAEWPKAFKSVKLMKLDITESEMFLTNNLKEGINLSQEQTKQILEILQGHSVALQQFVAYINNTVLEVDKYIELFTRRTGEMLNPSFQGEKSAIVAIQINIERLKSSQDSELAYEILNHLAYFNGDEMNFDILKILFPERSDANLETAVQKLSSYSLINIKTKNIFTVHSLIQKTLNYEHDNMSDRETYLNNCIKVFEDQLNVKEEILQHLQFAERWYLQFIYFISLNIENQKVNDFMLTKAAEIFYMLSTKGKYEDLIHFFEKIHKNSHSKHGKNHEETIDTMYWMARCYQNIRELDRSIELYQKVITQQKLLFGEDHRSTIKSMESLEDCYREKEMLKEEAELHTKVAKENNLLSREDDRDKSRSMNNLEYKNYKTKEVVKNKIKYYKKKLEKYQLSLGENHRATVKSMKKLGECYKENGMLEKAVECYEKTLEKTDENPRDPLRSLSKIGYKYQQQGMLKEAIEVIKQTLENRKSLLSENDRDTLRSMSNLAYCYKQQGMLEESIELYERTLEKRESLLGKNHPDTVRSMGNLAYCYKHKGMLKESIELLEKANTICKEIYDENNPLSKRISRYLRKYQKIITDNNEI